MSVTSLVLISAGAGAASADDPTPDPLHDLVTKVTQGVQQATTPVQQAGQQAQQQAQQGSSSSPSVPAAPSGSSATPADPTTPAATDNGISQPSAPDHASSHVLHGELLPGQTGSTPATADGGATSSTINDDGTSQADASLLAIGGMEVVPGAHASSSGQNDASGPAAPVCSGSGGAVCPLQEEAHASQTATSSDSSSKASATDICLTPPSQLNLDLPSSTSADCPTGLGIEALSSTSTMHRDKTTGETSGSTSSSLANVCVPGAPNSGCVGVLASQGSADSNGTTTRSSSIANFFGMEADTPLTEPNGVPDQLCHPATGSLPSLPPLPIPGLPGAPDLPAPTTGLCGYVNQGQTYLSSGLAAVSQTALSGDLLGIIRFDAGHSEVLAHQVPVAAVVSPPTTTTTQAPATTPAVIPAVHHATAAAAGDGGILPRTGGIWSGWLAIGLLTLAAGSALAARDLRRGRVTG